MEGKRHPFLVKRGNAEVRVFPHEVRHLVNALVEGAVRLVDGRSRERGPDEKGGQSV